MRQHGVTAVWAGVFLFIGGLALTGGGPVWCAAAQECSQTVTWTWMKGGSTVSQVGIYGTLETPAAANMPGARRDPVSWTDSAGKFWLFSGQGYPGSGSSGTSMICGTTIRPRAIGPG
jgi:hypothetical protein